MKHTLKYREILHSYFPWGYILNSSSTSKESLNRRSKLSDIDRLCSLAIIDSKFHDDAQKLCLFHLS